LNEGATHGGARRPGRHAGERGAFLKPPGGNRQLHADQRSEFQMVPRERRTRLLRLWESHRPATPRNTGTETRVGGVSRRVRFEQTLRATQNRDRGECFEVNPSKPELVWFLNAHPEG